MYEMLYTWSDGELTNDTAPDFRAVVEELELEERATSGENPDYPKGVYVTEVIIRYLPD